MILMNDNNDIIHESSFNIFIVFKFGYCLLIDKEKVYSKEKSETTCNNICIELLGELVQEIHRIYSTIGFLERVLPSHSNEVYLFQSIFCTQLYKSKHIRFFLFVLHEMYHFNDSYVQLWFVQEWIRQSTKFVHNLQIA